LVEAIHADVYSAREINVFTQILIVCFSLILAVYFFLDAVLFLLMKESREFKVDIRRLFWDVMRSAAFTIIIFSYIFRMTGISSTAGANVFVLDHLYFSAVTFSTLGFGDYRPLGLGKLAASAEAILGNFHLTFPVYLCGT